MNIDKEHLLKLIDKFQDGNATDDEITLLVNFYQYCQETKEWPTAVPNKDIVLNDLLSSIEKRITNSNNKIVKIKYLQFSRILKYAAVAIIFLGLGYFYQQGFFTNDSEIITPSENITLQLENGNIEIINEDGTSKIVDAQGNVVGSQNGTQLVYTNEVGSETLEYNTLTVPYGKRFEVKLSDGTVVNLNAGTSLKYPVKFIQGENRLVFLKGEAYFSVTKDAKHPFIVNSNKMNVRVLGTEFNISSYPEDEYINTVLVEGEVSIYSSNETYNYKTTTKLKPGYLAAWQKESQEVEVKSADIQMSTAWMKGRMILKEVAFNDILKKLERQYNVSFINNNSSLNNRFFTARFDIEDINVVMENLSQYASFKYVIYNNQIIIN